MSQRKSHDACVGRRTSPQDLASLAEHAQSPLPDDPSGCDTPRCYRVWVDTIDGVGYYDLGFTGTHDVADFLDVQP